jgi:hypothetical protein
MFDPFAFLQVSARMDAQGRYAEVGVKLNCKPEPAAQSIRGSDCGSKGMGFDRFEQSEAIFSVHLNRQDCSGGRVVGTLLLHQLVRWCQYNVTSRP